jgi:hypothetical protein
MLKSIASWNQIEEHSMNDEKEQTDAKSAYYSEMCASIEV